MMDGYEVCMECPAKANLFLEVTDRRNDGFHNIVSVFQPLDFLTDTLCANRAPGISLQCDVQSIPVDASNLIIKAATLLQQECGITEGIAFHLTKRIPDGGGLGGGSSDAAAALKICNSLWKTGLTDDQLAGLALRIGSDVPYFIYGGVCLCEGRGEIITQIKGVAPLPLTVVAPSWKISTPLAYRSLDPATFNHHPIERFLSKLKNGEKDCTDDNFNCFEKAVFALEPRQAALQQRLKESGAKPMMSGSGSCILCFNPNADIAGCLTDEFADCAVINV